MLDIFISICDFIILIIPNGNINEKWKICVWISLLKTVFFVQSK